MFFGEMNDLADQFLTGHIVGMGFTGKNKLNRAVVVPHKLQQSFRVAKKQVTALVSGKAAGKTQCKGLRGKGVFRFMYTALNLTGPLVLIADAVTDKSHQPFPAAFVGSPKLLIGNPFHAVPDRKISRCFVKMGAEIPGKQFTHVAGNPGPRVYTVSYMTDWDFIQRQARP